MLTKQEQQSWLKIQCAQSRTARQCHEGLVETCGETALPYRTVVTWVRTFNEGRESVADLARVGCLTVSLEQVPAVIHRSTSEDTRVRSRDRVITYDCTTYSKESSGLNPQDMMEVQR